MGYNEVTGDLIQMALIGSFDVIGHGCNCQNTMQRGIAPQLAEIFRCNEFHKESPEFKGEMNKLGTIDAGDTYLPTDSNLNIYSYTCPKINNRLLSEGHKHLRVYNLYTQYDWRGEHPLDYEALTLCMRKLNVKEKGKHIGLPKLGAGLAKGDWSRIKAIIQTELSACDVTIVIFKEQTND